MARVEAVGTAKAAVFAALALPGALLAFDLAAGRLAAPYRTILHETGLWSMRLLAATLLLSPLAGMGFVFVSRFRRMFGLYGAFYALVHAWAWCRLYAYDWPLLWGEATMRLYLVVGVFGFALLAPLAATSHDIAHRALGPARWRRLHLLIYPATILALLHFWLSRRAAPLELALEATATLVALAWRLRR